MRIAAGILMIIVGLTLFATVENIHQIFGTTEFVPVSLILFGLILAGAVNAFRRASYGWALAGAILSVIIAVIFTVTSLLTFPVAAATLGGTIGTATFYIMFLSLGILAVIFLTKRKGEFD